MKNPKRLLVSLEMKDWRRVKIFCAKNDLSVAELMRRLVTAFLKNPQLAKEG